MAEAITSLQVVFKLIGAMTQTTDLSSPADVLTYDKTCRPGSALIDCENVLQSSSPGDRRVLRRSGKCSSRKSMRAVSSGVCANRVDRGALRFAGSISMVDPFFRYREMITGCTYDFRAIAGVLPRSAATNLIV